MDFVFHHGGGQGGWIWEATIAAMDAQAPGAHRYLVLDVPGCGTKRARDTSALGFPEMVAELTAEIVDAGLVDPVFVGHSQAGTVLPVMLAKNPGLFARAILISCIAPEPGVALMDAVLIMHEYAGTAVSRAFTDVAMPPREANRIKFCNDMAPAQAEAFLDRLGQDRWPDSARAWTDWEYGHLGRVPTTYVLCLDDAVLPPSWQERYAALLGARRIVRIDAGHQPMVTRPHALAEIVLAEVG